MTIDPEMKNLIGLNREELTAEISAIGEKPFRANQLWHWMYHRGEMDFANMTTLSKGFRQKLSEHFVIQRPGVSRELTSKDSSRKWLLDFTDGNEAETVFIPEEDRGALCHHAGSYLALLCADRGLHIDHLRDDHRVRPVGATRVDPDQHRGLARPL